MTKKDYELIAETLHGRLWQMSDEQKDIFSLIVSDLASAFQEANHRFDRVKFISAVYRD